jgi:hypothetical protein
MIHSLDGTLLIAKSKAQQQEHLSMPTQLHGPLLINQVIITQLGPVYQEAKPHNITQTTVLGHQDLYPLLLLEHHQTQVITQPQLLPQLLQPQDQLFQQQTHQEPQLLKLQLKLSYVAHHAPHVQVLLTLNV